MVDIIMTVREITNKLNTSFLTAVKKYWSHNFIIIDWDWNIDQTIKNCELFCS